jgi:hypothetical protein
MKKYLDKTEMTNAKKKNQQCQISVENEKEFEHCVLCKKKLNIRRDTHMAFRAYYVEGCGQLCRECFISLYVDGGGQN